MNLRTLICYASALPLILSTLACRAPDSSKAKDVVEKNEDGSATLMRLSHDRYLGELTIEVLSCDQHSVPLSLKKCQKREGKFTARADKAANILAEGMSKTIDLTQYYTPGQRAELQAISGEQEKIAPGRNEVAEKKEKYDAAGAKIARLQKEIDIGETKLKISGPDKDVSESLAGLMKELAAAEQDSTNAKFREWYDLNERLDVQESELKKKKYKIEIQQFADYVNSVIFYLNDHAEWHVSYDKQELVAVFSDGTKDTTQTYSENGRRGFELLKQYARKRNN
jgi:hypothetical protein